MINKEGIRKSDKGLEFDWEKYKSEDIIPLKPVHKQFIKKKVSIFVAYAFLGIYEYIKRNPNVSKQEAKDIIDTARRELKNLSSPDIQHNVGRMVDESLNKFDIYHPLTKFNLIISPKSSSPLNNFIMEKIKSKTHGEVMVMSDAVVKNVIRNIQVNWDLVNREKSDKTKAAVPEYYKSLMNNPDDLYAVKKVPASYRRYFVNFLKWADGINPFWLSMNANKGSILIVDDTVGEGSTVNEMVNLLSKYNPNQINVFSMFLDYGAGYDDLPTPKF